MKLPRLSAALGVEDLEVNEEGLMLTSEQLEQLESRISDDSGASAAEEANLLEATVSDLQTQLEASQNRVSELESELAEARKLPAEEPAAMQVETDSSARSEDVNRMLEGMSMKDRVAYLNRK